MRWRISAAVIRCWSADSSDFSVFRVAIRDLLRAKGASQLLSLDIIASFGHAVHCGDVGFLNLDVEIVRISVAPGKVTVFAQVRVIAPWTLASSIAKGAVMMCLMRVARTLRDSACPTLIAALVAKLAQSYNRASATKASKRHIGTISYPVSPEDWFPLRHADWARLHSRVESLAEPVPYIGQLGWACVGFGGSALFALIPWTAADSQLLAAAHDHYAWVTPSLAIFGIASFVVSAFCLCINRRIRRQQRATLAQVLEDMDSCYRESNHSADEVKTSPG
jgi:hypothetical protein